MRFLTMSDLRFLPQTLVLLRALNERSPGCRVDVLCGDQPTLGFFEGAGLDRVVPVPLEQLEAHDPELASTRRSRTWREYCWTATPSFCAFALDADAALEQVTWLDADTMPFRDPAVLVEELGDGSVQLVPHRYHRVYPTSAPGDYLERHYGRFNGGTITFRRAGDGPEALALWRERTLEWCHFRTEPGRFGNQVYLEELLRRFPGVRVAEALGAALAPWNASQHEFADGADGPLVDGQPVIFYHYQSLALYGGRWAAPLPPNWFRVPSRRLALIAQTAPWLRQTRPERRLLWRPYLERLADAVDTVVDAGLPLTAELPRLGTRLVGADLMRKLRLGHDRVAVPPARRLRAAVRRRSRAGGEPLVQVDQRPPGDGPVEEALDVGSPGG